MTQKILITVKSEIISWFKEMGKFDSTGRKFIELGG